jgi:taurine dioxygenase
MPEEEALALLADLLEHATWPQYNTATSGGLATPSCGTTTLLHKANGDYDMDQLRYLYRIMLPGDVPA